MPIKIYDAEKLDGLAQTIQNACSVAYLSEIHEVKADPVLQKQTEMILASLREKSLASELPVDLFYLETILVTTCWNKNDDVFTPSEVWAAKATPEDKPFNFEHNETDIIGHIVGSVPIDDELKVLPSNLTVEQLPSKFHLKTGAVLYKHWDNEERAARTEKIIANLPNWFVSMEALFTDFDYAVIDDTGRQFALARGAETAFLTKHLRSFGGTGRFKNFTLGRILKNIVFSGKGLVAKPANPESVILTAVSSFNGKIENINFKENRMSDVLETTVAELKTQLKEAKATIDEMGKALKAADTKASEEKITKLEAALTDYKKTESELSSKIDELNKQVADSNDSVAKLTEEKVALEAIVKAAKEDMEKNKKEQKTKSRIEALKGAGKTKEQAEALAKTFDALADDQFDTFVLEISVKPKADAVTEVNTEVATEVLENAEEVVEPVLATEASVKVAEQELFDSLATLIGKTAFKSTSKIFADKE